MRRRAGALAFATLVTVGTLGAQATRLTPGAVVNGKVVLRLHVVLRDDVTPYYPVTGLELRLFRNALDSTLVVTDAAGTATVLLAPGDYRLVSAREAVWKGNRYSWSIPLTVQAGMSAIDLREPLSAGAATVMAAEEVTPTTFAASPGIRPTAPPRSVDLVPIPRRDGFWLSLGMGAGSIGCDGCDDRLTGLSGNFSLGGTTNDHVLLGAFFNGWTKSADGVTLTAGTLTGGIRVYPNLMAGAFFAAGLGISSVELDTGGFGKASDVGAGAMLGFGVDIRAGRMVSVTPYVNGLGISINGVTAHVLQAGFGVTWH